VDSFKKKYYLLCSIIFVLIRIFYFNPTLYDYNLAYKNDKYSGYLSKEKISNDLSEEQFSLPIVYIYSYDIDNLIKEWHWSPDGPVLPEREKTLADIYVFDNGLNNITDKATQVYYNASIKLRGRTSSYAQEKKPFSLELRDGKNKSLDSDFLSLDKDSDFVLHAPQLDRSLIRNYVAYSLQNQILDWSPECRFAEVFLDTPNTEISMDDYVGVYLIVEKIKNSELGLNLNRYIMSPSQDEQFETGGNFIFKADAYEEGYDTSLRLAQNKFGNQYTLVYPKEDSISSTEVNSIFNEIERYEEALYNGSDEEFEQYYDIEQYARCLILNEFVRNCDGWDLSMFFYRQQSEKLKCIQWDFDIAFGNRDYASDLSNAEGFFIFNKDSVKQYLKHTNVKNMIIEQWSILREEGGPLSDANIIKIIDEAELSLDGAWQRDHERYPYLFSTVNFVNQTINFDNSQEEREYLKQFLIERGHWLDENIHTIKELY